MRNAHACTNMQGVHRMHGQVLPSHSTCIHRPLMAMLYGSCTVFALDGPYPGLPPWTSRLDSTQSSSQLLRRNIPTGRPLLLASLLPAVQGSSLPVKGILGMLAERQSGGGGAARVAPRGRRHQGEVVHWRPHTSCSPQSVISKPALGAVSRAADFGETSFSPSMPWRA